MGKRKRKQLLRRKTDRQSVSAAHKLVYTCFCRECGVYTPKRSTPEEALSDALQRAELKKDEKEKA